MANRIDYIDTYRGIGIILVILGHTLSSSTLTYKLIYSFHMPAFYFISGYLFSLSETSRLEIFVRDKFLRLILPAWIIGSICAVPFLLKVLNSNLPLNIFLSKYFGTLTGANTVAENFNTTPLWFLFSLFLVYIIAKLIKSYFSSNYFAAAFVISIVYIFIRSYIPFGLYMHFSTALIGLFYFTLGGFYRAKQVKIDQILFLNHSSSIVIFILMWIAICIQFSSTLNFSNAEIGNGIYILINILVSVLGIISLLLSSRLLKGNKLLSFLGANTIPIIGFNYFVSGRLAGHFSNPILLTIANVLIFIVIILILDRLGTLGSAISGKWQPYSGKKK